MYSQPQDDALGPLGAAEAPGQLEPAAPAAGAGAQDVHGPAASTARHQAHVSSLLAEIARAMQAAAAQERDRIHAGVAEDEAFQIEKVRNRATAESAALRKGADDDVRQVESWCEEQIRQIHAAGPLAGVDDRRRELEQSVTQHGTLIETEVESVHGAVQGYRDSLDAFFAVWPRRRSQLTASLAGTLPDPPDLDVVRPGRSFRRAAGARGGGRRRTRNPPSGEGRPMQPRKLLSTRLSSGRRSCERGGAGARDGSGVLHGSRAVMDPDAMSSNERVQPVPVMDSQPPPRRTRAWRSG